MFTPWIRRRVPYRSHHRATVPPSLERLEDRLTPAEIWVSFTGLSPVATTNTPTLSWQASEGVIRYDLSIYRSSDLTVPVQSYAGLTGTSFTVPQPLSNDQYRVTITAHDAANETYSNSRFLLVSHLAPVAHVIFVNSMGTMISADTTVPPVLPGFGGLEAADWAVNYGAYRGGLLPDWNGLDIWYKAILSTPSVNARDRFPVLGAIYNTHGDLVAANYQQLWSGTLSNPVGYFENGAPVPPGIRVWTGTHRNGTWDPVGSCGSWNVPQSFGAIGNPSDSDLGWTSHGLFECSSPARLYAISPYIGRPTVTSLGVDQAASDEGDTVTLSGSFLDAVYQDTAAVTVLWGDGQSDTLHLDAGASIFSASHRYLDNRPGDAPYTIDVTVLDDGGGSTSASTAVTVHNVAPTVAVNGPDAGVVGHPLSFTADVSDAGTLDGHTFAWEVRDRHNAVLATASELGIAFTPLATGTYTVSLSVTDVDGASSTASQTVRVTRVGIGYGSADPTALLVVGTAGADTIRVEPKGTAGDVKVLLNGVNKGVFPAASFTSIVLEGLGGGDVLKVASGISKPAFLFGGAGNDQLRGGAGPSVLVGAYGKDVLNGGTGRNVLIGGFQADRLIGLGEEDVLIAGNVTFEANGAALAAVLAEWRSERDYPTRIANLRGEGSGPRENEDVFLSALGGNATVLEDAAQDTLKGGAGLDWFFAHPDAPFRDVLADRLDTETLDERG